LTELAEREAAWHAALPKLEREREEALARATAELTEYEKEYAPRRAEQEKEREAKVAQLAADLKQYEETTLAKKQAEWEKSRKRSPVDWVRLDPRVLTATGQTKLRKLDDLSILATGKPTRTAYTVEAGTDLRGITAVRLEVLADDRLPAGGPGRAASNGNFVLNEFNLSAAPKADPKKAQKVFFVNARADFNQENFPIKSAVDGSTNAGKGWAVSPNGGVTHWAVFELKEPIDLEGGAVLTFTLAHNFGLVDHSIGRFRLSVAAAKTPVALGLADDLQTALDTPAGQRDQAQKLALAKYYRSTDKDYRAKADALAAAQRPLPPDPKLVALQAAVKEAEKPVPTDPRLAQVRQDTDASAAQLANKRLTAAQDVAWALINSPAFLFNH
jgi:hypothetical protein